MANRFVKICASILQKHCNLCAVSSQRKKLIFSAKSAHVRLRLFQITNNRNLHLNNIDFQKESESDEDDAAKTDHQKQYFEKEKKKDIVTSEYFSDYERKNKENFQKAIDIFKKQDSRKRGAVEFIYASLKNMKEFGVNRDLETYKAILDVFPKGKYVPENMIQANMFHYPKQQECAIFLLSQMERNKVVPDREMSQMLINIFGMRGDTYKKFARMLYWMPRFKNLSPWPLPEVMPKDTLSLARLAIRRITSVDLKTVISEYDTAELPNCREKTWIVSGHSPEQVELLGRHPRDKTLYVEGTFNLWLKNSQVSYFVLRGDRVEKPDPPDIDTDKVSKIKMWMFSNPATEVEKSLIPSVHEQDEGIIFACCATGTSSEQSLVSWIQFLQLDIKILSEFTIMFVQKSPLAAVTPYKE